ncbi:MAG: glycosyltransferase family 39 protein [Anaerolineales bacterium]|nr:glycosyltransferase family 39 protein [Anaerolineales bacterium]
MSVKRANAHLIIVLVLLAAFGLRVFWLDAQSLWWDEGISLHLATSSLPELWADRAQRLHPPGYFILLRGWLALVGVSPFTARYLSVLASLGQVTAVYATTRSWFAKLPHGKTAVWIATLLIALSPLSIIYGQETRVYAFLPLIYFAMLLAATKLIDDSVSHSRKWWLVLGLTEWAGVHLHYITFLLVAVVNAWLLWHILRQQRSLLYHWLVTQLIVTIVSLPWFLSVLFNVVAVRDRVDTGRFLADPVPPDYLFRQIWTFHFTGLAGALGRDGVRVVAAGTAVLFLILLLWQCIQKNKSAAFWRLLTVWAVPLGLAFLIWSVRSFSHPRYIAIYALGIFPLIAYLVVSEHGGRMERRLHRGVAFLLVGSVAVLSFLSLDDYFFDPQVAKDDIRGVATWLEGEAAADDLILVPDEDWSLPFEYDGPARIGMLGTAQQETMWTNLAQLTAVPRRVFLLDYEKGTHDWQHVTPFALERAGALQEVVAIDALVLHRYALDGPVTRPEMEPVDAQFESLHLVGASIEQEAAAETAVTVALRWQFTEAVADDLQVSLAVQTVDGWQVATVEQALVNENGRPTSAWPAGVMTTTYHIVLLPVGVPPLTYRVSVSAFAPLVEGGIRVLDLGNAPGQRFELGDAVLRAGSGVHMNPYRLQNPFPPMEPIAPAEGLLLRGAAVDRAQAAPGQSLFVQLQWQAETALPEIKPALRLVQADEIVLEMVDAPVLADYPTTKWRPGEIVTEHRRLQVPPGLAGRFDVMVGVGETAVSIGTINIVPTEHDFVRPQVQQPLSVQFGEVAQLVGVTLPQTDVQASEPLSLTLYWESLATGVEMSYTVFVHLVDENGRILAQHDAQPVNGQRPTSGWVEGEFITDDHVLAFHSTDFTGEAYLVVGMYDAGDGTRLLSDDGTDAAQLPVRITVLP